jgi:hypothetical protein
MLIKTGLNMKSKIRLFFVSCVVVLQKAHDAMDANIN